SDRLGRLMLDRPGLAIEGEGAPARWHPPWAPKVRIISTFGAHARRRGAPVPRRTQSTPARRERLCCLPAPLRLEQRRGLGRRFEAEVGEGMRCRDAAAGRALEEAALQQVGLVDVLDRVLLLADGDRQGRQADGAAAELLAHGGQDLAVEAVQAEVVD